MFEQLLNFLNLFGAVIDTGALPNHGDRTNPEQIIVEFAFALAASVAFLMIVVNALRYILARGDPGAVSSARNGILYALVGLVVVMAAYSIVVFVIGNIG